MASKTAKRHRMRCGVESCRQRWTLKRHPDEYKRSPACPACGNVTKVRHVEDERRRELAKQERCTCGAYPFPHRKGSLRMCDSHPLVDVEPTIEEIYDYEACLATPRSG